MKVYVCDYCETKREYPCIILRGYKPLQARKSGILIAEPRRDLHFCDTSCLRAWMHNQQQLEQSS